MTWVLYTRIGCGLCEDMEHALKAFKVDAPHRDFDYKTVDIDRDSDLKKRFNADVPLLLRGDEVVLQYFYDEARLTQVLIHD